jgi:hypothetical protein
MGSSSMIELCIRHIYSFSRRTQAHDAYNTTCLQNILTLHPHIDLCVKMFAGLHH